MMKMTSNVVESMNIFFQKMKNKNKETMDRNICCVSVNQFDVGAAIDTFSLEDLLNPKDKKPRSQRNDKQRNDSVVTDVLCINFRDDRGNKYVLFPNFCNSKN